MSKSRVTKLQHKDKYAASAALAQKKREQEQARWKLAAERSKAGETEKHRGIDPNSAFAEWEQRLLFPENFETNETDPDVELLKVIFPIRDNA